MLGWFPFFHGNFSKLILFIAADTLQLASGTISSSRIEREVFPLIWSKHTQSHTYIELIHSSEQSLPPELEELSKHNGFDSRLCFGDVVLGFRFFPEGLPEELLNRHLEENAEEVEKQQQHTLEQMQPSSSNVLTPSTPAAEHNWTHLPSKQGKLWLLFFKNYYFPSRLPFLVCKL